MQKDDVLALSKGQLFIISAPAGTGKTTLVNRLKNEVDYVRETVSCTTRAPREKEVHGADYFFMTQEEFKMALAEAAFLESVELYGHYYGTLYSQVKNLQDEGYHVLLVIDTQGAMKLKSKQIEATFIFISPPSIEELERRLYLRATESSELIQKRLNWAHQEMQQAHLYDHNIVNDDLDQAYNNLKKVIQKNIK